MNKLIRKTVFYTFAGIITAIAIFYVAFDLFFPKVLYAFCDGLGWEKGEAYYSQVVYKKTGEIDDLALTFDLSFDVEWYDEAVSYGEELIARSDFESYCNKIDKIYEDNPSVKGSYKQYAYGLVSVSYYKLNNSAKAIEKAFMLNESEFEINNSAVKLIFSVIQDNNIKVAKEIQTKMNTISQSGEYFNKMNTILNNYIIKNS